MSSLLASDCLVEGAAVQGCVQEQESRRQVNVKSSVRCEKRHDLYNLEGNTKTSMKCDTVVFVSFVSVEV